MKREINIGTWKRKDHFEFFSRFEEPFYGVTVKIDCTAAHQYAKENQQSFFLTYLYLALKAANQIEEFRYRIVADKVFIYDQVNVASTVDRPDGTFGFSYVNYQQDQALFTADAIQVMERVRQGSGLKMADPDDHVIHFSALPWIDFTSLSHARSFSVSDSSPKISFGKYTDENGVKTMPVSIHVNHALVDGYHVGQFVAGFQKLMNQVGLADDFFLQQNLTPIVQTP